eukprot:1156509-Pelagomonas_calceolata.AAC.6
MHFFTAAHPRAPDTRRERLEWRGPGLGVNKNAISQQIAVPLQTESPPLGALNQNALSFQPLNLESR